MRGCATDSWVDFEGRFWPIVASANRLKFKYPAHAALRRHVFHRDHYRCRRCDVGALDVPDNYDGRSALWTATVLPSGYHDVLVLDHVITLRGGGRNVVENLQTLCETCNKRKQREDAAAAAAYAESVAF